MIPKPFAKISSQRAPDTEPNTCWKSEKLKSR